MDKTILVEKDIEEGRRLIEVLQQNGFPVSSAFWLYKPEPEEWRLTFASPLYDEQGPLKSYQFIQSVLSKLSPPIGISITDTSVVSSHNELVENLRHIPSSKSPQLSEIRLRGNSINNKYIDDIYIYYVNE